MESGDGSSSRCFDDGTKFGVETNVGVEESGPFGTETVGDLSEDHAGTQRLFHSRYWSAGRLGWRGIETCVAGTA